MKTLAWTEIAEALTRKVSAVSGSETLSIQGASGRVLAEPLVAISPLPAHTHAVMDGYALGSNPPGFYRMKAAGAKSLEIDEAAPVAAGGTIPTGTAGVVLADHASRVDDKLAVNSALAKINIRRSGEEAYAGESILPAGTKLDVRHLGLALASGNSTVAVRKRPHVALLGLHDGDIVFPHGPILAALLDSPALHFTHAGNVRPDLLTTMLLRLAPHHDLIVVVAESLDAEGGILEAAINKAGGKTHIYRASMKPAKPVISGRMGDAHVLGLAGTAYATCVGAHLLLRPILQTLLGLPVSHDFLPVTSGFERFRKSGRAEALPVRISYREEKLIAEPAGRFGQLRALAAMDGFVVVPADAQAIIAEMALPFKKLSFPLV